MLRRRTANGDQCRGSERPRRDAGLSFIELLVSIVLLGTAGVAVLVALSATILAARTHDNISQNQLLLAEAIDLITDTNPEQVPYVDCDSNPVPAYQADIDAAFTPGVITVSALYWQADPNGDGVADDGVFGPTCFHSSGDRLQQIRLTTVVDGVTKEVRGIKRPIDVPTVGTVPAAPPPPFAGGAGQAVVSPTPGIDGP